MEQIQNVEIKGDFITLSQLLKILDFIQSGGEAKSFIYLNKIILNNEKENRRGKKIYKGDEVIINDEVFRIC